MRGHVHEMTGGGRELLQTGGAGQRALGVRRRLNRVNVVMIRAKVIRVTF